MSGTYQSMYCDRQEDLIGEKIKKFNVRNFQNNTRMNIKNRHYQEQQIKRDRMVNYWQNQVVPNHFPTIDKRLRNESM